MESDQLLRPRDISRILNVSLPLAYQLLSSGAIRAIRFQRTVRCRPVDLEAFLANHQVGDHPVNSTSSGNSKIDG